MTNNTTTTNREIIATVTRNLEHDGIEITFNDCPNAKTRTALKSNGFRWHNVKHIWYAKATGKHIEFCKKQKWIIPEIENEKPEKEEAAPEPTDMEAALKRISELEAELAKLKAPKTAKITRTEKTDSSILNRLANVNKNMERFGKAHKQIDGTYIFSNGYIALSDKNNHGLEEAEGHERFNLSELFKQAPEAEMIVDLTALSEWCKTHKKSEKKPFILNHGNDVIGVNPWYLKDCLTWCNTDIIRVSKPNAPVFVIGKERNAICMPIKVR